AVSFSPPRFSCRQRLGVHQSSGGGNVAEAARRIHEEPGVPEPGQCSGGRQERRGDPQADRVRTHRRPARCGAAELLPGAPQSVPEFSPALRLRHSELGRARQTATQIQDRRLPDAVRETAIAARSGAVIETGIEFAGTREAGAGHQRHRMRSPDECGQGQVASAMPDAVVAEVRLTEGRGNAGPVESVENQTQVFHASHRPLKIPQNPRDFHISTARACAAWKSGKPKSGFPLFHPAHAMTMTVSLSKPKNQRKEVGRYAASSFSYPPLSLRSSGIDFMLIFRLENVAPNGCVRPVHSCCEWLPVECAAAVQNASYRKAQHSDIRTRRRISGSLSLFDIL